MGVPRFTAKLVAKALHSLPRTKMIVRIFPFYGPQKGVYDSMIPSRDMSGDLNKKKVRQVSVDKT